jgi:D-glycero-alpha-D-manno-heptose-7-phosphate kinase
MNIIKKVRAPVRIDFAGGTTDIYPFTHTYGGAVLNAGINRYVEGKIIKTDKKTHLEYTGHTPTSSGLGTSGVMNLVWLALISDTKDKEKLAQDVYKMEQSLGGVGGKQDQYAGAFGGINFLEFKEDKVIRTQVRLKESFVKELERNLVLVYTGLPHFATNANRDMIENIKKGRHIQNLLKIKEVAYEMKKALERKNLVGFSALMNEETRNRKELAKGVLPPGAEKIMKDGFNNGASGAKILGSGNGGSILFFGDKKKLTRKFGNSVIDFKFDFEGLKWM